MNTKEQLKVMSEQLINCFTCDSELPIRVIVFILTGLCVLWFYIALAIYCFVIEMLQTVGNALHLFVSNEERSGVARAAMLFICYPVASIRYCVVPFMFIGLFIQNFLFNCFVYAVSLGKSKWYGLQFNK